MKKKIYLLLLIQFFIIKNANAFSYFWYPSDLEKLKDPVISNYSISPVFSISYGKKWDFDGGIIFGLNLIKIKNVNHEFWVKVDKNNYKKTYFKRGTGLLIFETGLKISYQEFIKNKNYKILNVPMRLKLSYPNANNASVFYFLGIDLGLIFKSHKNKENEELKKMNFKYVLGVGGKNDYGFQSDISLICGSKFDHYAGVLGISFDIIQLVNYNKYPYKKVAINYIKND